jgi:hypothetical protein
MKRTCFETRREYVLSIWNNSDLYSLCCCVCHIIEGVFPAYFPQLLLMELFPTEEFSANCFFEDFNGDRCEIVNLSCYSLGITSLVPYDVFRVRELRIPLRRFSTVAATSNVNWFYTPQQAHNIGNFVLHVR